MVLRKGSSESRRVRVRRGRPTGPFHAPSRFSKSLIAGIASRAPVMPICLEQKYRFVHTHVWHMYVLSTRMMKWCVLRFWFHFNSTRSCTHIYIRFSYSAHKLNDYDDGCLKETCRCSTAAAIIIMFIFSFQCTFYSERVSLIDGNLVTIAEDEI